MNSEFNTSGQYESTIKMLKGMASSNKINSRSELDDYIYFCKRIGVPENVFTEQVISDILDSKETIPTIDLNNTTSGNMMFQYDSNEVKKICNSVQNLDVPSLTIPSSGVGWVDGIVSSMVDTSSISTLESEIESVRKIILNTFNKVNDTVLFNAYDITGNYNALDHGFVIKSFGDKTGLGWGNGQWTTIEKNNGNETDPQMRVFYWYGGFDENPTSMKERGYTTGAFNLLHQYGENGNYKFYGANNLKTSLMAIGAENLENSNAVDVYMPWSAGWRSATKSYIDYANYQIEKDNKVNPSVFLHCDGTAGITSNNDRTGFKEAVRLSNDYQNPYIIVNEPTTNGHEGFSEALKEMQPGSWFMEINTDASVSHAMADDLMMSSGTAQIITNGNGNANSDHILSVTINKLNQNGQVEKLYFNGKDATINKYNKAFDNTGNSLGTYKTKDSLISNESSHVLNDSEYTNFLVTTNAYMNNQITEEQYMSYFS